MGHPALELTGHWVELGLSVETDLWETLTELYYVVLGGPWWSNVLNLALPLQRFGPDTNPEHQDPVSHMAQKKREKERDREERRVGKECRSRWSPYH